MSLKSRLPWMLTKRKTNYMEIRVETRSQEKRPAQVLGKGRGGEPACTQQNGQKWTDSGSVWRDRLSDGSPLLTPECLLAPLPFLQCLSPDIQSWVV